MRLIHRGGPGALTYPGRFDEKVVAGHESKPERGEVLVGLERLQRIGLVGNSRAIDNEDFVVARGELGEVVFGGRSALVDNADFVLLGPVDVGQLPWGATVDALRHRGLLLQLG
ncbi:MAG: hypothetical protein AAGA95_20515 [Pseudomonadota bacterium]